MHTYGYLQIFVTLAVLRIFGPAAFLEESSVIAHRLQSIPRTGCSPTSDPVSKRSLLLGLKDSGNFAWPSDGRLRGAVSRAYGLSVPRPNPYLIL